MVPRQHSGSDNSIEMSVQKKVWRACHARWWGDPRNRVPTRRWHGNEEKHASDNFGHGANTCISYNTCIRSRKVVSGLYLRSVHFSKRIKFVEGSRRSRDVVEVVVHVS